jgi:hypothetical protein
MERAVWSLGVVAAFVIGFVVAGGARQETTSQTVQRLQDEITTLHSRLDAREDEMTTRSGAVSASAGGSWSDLRAEGPPANRALSAAAMQERTGTASRDVQASPPTSPPPDSAAVARPASPPATVDAALQRLRAYVEATNRGDGREQWRRARELVGELRAIGEPAAIALMQVLESGQDSDERRAAARLLGALNVGQSLPLLRDVLERDDDLLLRRSAAAALRQLQTPEAVPVMERIVANPGEDRFVRLSAAAGLADAGRPLGVSALTHIFDESTADGRGRDLAFRALVALNDERPLPFMRQLVTAQAEPGYRLRAIQYVMAQGDRQSLTALQTVINTPGEQPSIRDAATQAYTSLSSAR